MLLCLPPWSLPVPPPTPNTRSSFGFFFFFWAFLEKWVLEHKPELDTRFCRTTQWKQKITVYFDTWNYKADLNNPEQHIFQKVHVYPQTLNWITSRKAALEVFPRYEGTGPWKRVNSYWMSPFLLGIPGHIPFLGSPMSFFIASFRDGSRIENTAIGENLENASWGN